MNNYTSITLGELLSHTNEIIKRNAISILKQLQKDKQIKCPDCKAIIWDKKTIDQRLNKCHGCGLRFD